MSKINRGLEKGTLNLLAGSKLLDLLKSDKELFLGIRNNYFNVYFMGASIGKGFVNRKNQTLKIANKYLNSSLASGYSDITVAYLIKNLSSIKNEVKKFQVKKFEKIAQQKLVINNNLNPDSEWYCVDMEYVQQRENSDKDKYGRFDIIAISKQKQDDGKYKVALIELKVGFGAFSGFTDDFRKKMISNPNYFKRQKNCKVKVGSGILGHLYDYIGYTASGNLRLA
ncbi:MAG: hypothetical protein WCQ41_07115 [Bacillota bacterium]